MLWHQTFKKKLHQITSMSLNRSHQGLGSDICKVTLVNSSNKKLLSIDRW